MLMPTAAYPEGVFRHFSWTRAIKQSVSIPVIGSGYSRLKNGDKALHVADRSKADFLYWAEKNVRDGHTDLVGVGRQSIADPEFARKILEGRASDVRWCITCQECTTAPWLQQARGLHDLRQGIPGVSAEKMRAPLCNVKTAGRPFIIWGLHAIGPGRHPTARRAADQPPR